MKKIILAALVFVMIFAFTVTAYAQGFEANAKAYILIDAGSGDVMAEKNADEQLPCASVAKVMTILLLLEAEESGRLSLSDTATVSDYAASMGGTQAFLDANSTHKVEDLLKAVIVCSANDAAVTLAEKTAGSEAAFVEMMNKKAGALGIGATFVNATGLGDEQKISARDAATVCRELVKYSLFYKWSSIWMDNYSHPDGRKTEMVNQNKLVRFYEGSDGVATGSSGAAGYCIAATVKRSGGRFIYIELGAPNSQTRFDDAKAAFDYAFAGFTAKTLVTEGQKLGSDLAIAGGTEPFIDVYAGQGFSTLIEKGKEATLEKELVLLENITAPIEKGQVLGYLRILLDGAEIGRVDAVAADSVDERNFSNAFKRVLTWWLFT